MFRAPLCPSSGAQELYRWLLPVVLGAVKMGKWENICARRDVIRSTSVQLINKKDSLASNSMFWVYSLPFTVGKKHELVRTLREQRRRLCVHTSKCRSGLICILTYLITYLPLYILIYLLTPCSIVLLEKLAGFQLVKHIPAFYGTRMFITEVTRARRLSLPWASSIQSTPPHPNSWRLYQIACPFFVA